MPSLKSLAADTAVYGFSTIAARLINYLLVAYHTRVLDQGQYGVFTEFYSYITLLLVVLTYGMETGFFRFASRSGCHPERVFSTALASLAASGAVFLCIVMYHSDAIACAMGYPRNPNYVRALAAVAAIDALCCIPFARLRLQRKAKTFALLKLLNVLFYVGLNICMFSMLPQYLSENPYSLLHSFLAPAADVGYVFTANLAASIFTLLLLLPAIAGVRVRPSPALLKQMLLYSFPLLCAGLPGVANDYIDRILFKHLLPAADALPSLGVYGANAKLAVLMTLFVQMFRYAAEPFFFSHSNHALRTAIFADIMKYFVAAAVFIFLFVTLFLDVFVLFMGESFRVGARIVPIMLMANLLFGITFNLSIWYKLTARTSMAVYITAAGLAVTILVNTLWLPLYGYAAAAWAHLLSNFVMAAISFILGQRFYPVPYPLRRIALYLGCCIVFYGLFLTLCNIFLLEGVFKILLASFLLVVYLLLLYCKERSNFLSKSK